MGMLRDWHPETINESQQDHGHIEEKHSREVGSAGLASLPAILPGSQTLQHPANYAIGEENKQRIQAHG